nr:hypothetical protein [Candidatus Freyrarchaeum guaymaensis]
MVYDGSVTLTMQPSSILFKREERKKRVNWVHASVRCWLLEGL